MSGVISAAEHIAKEKKEAGAVKQVRMDAARRMKNASLPELQYGLGIETTLNFSFDELPFSQAGVDIQVQVDGTAHVHTVKDAADRYGEEILDGYSQLVKPGDKVWCLHYALAQNRVVYIPADETATITIDTTLEKQVGSGHILIVTGHNATAHILEQQHAKPVQARNNPVVATTATEIMGGEGSHVTYTTLQTFTDEVNGFAKQHSHHAKDCTVDWYNIYTGGKLIKAETTSQLEGKGSDTTNNTAFHTTGTQHVDMLDAVKHRSPYTDSTMEARGVQNGKSTSIYRGMVDIGEEAPHVTGRQNAKTLLLSEEARNSSLPILEINNNEVDTEHAAATTQLGEEELFYMTSRGLTREEAEKLVVEGFFTPAIQDIPRDSFRDAVEQVLREEVHQA